MRIKIGKTEWNTSLFPHRKSNCHLLAVRAQVQKKEKLAEEDRVRAVIAIW